MYYFNKIISVANELNQTGTTVASTGERIAAAFVINRMDYLPDNYSDVLDAWMVDGKPMSGLSERITVS